MNCCNSVDIKRRKGFPGGVEGKELPADSGDVDLIPGSGRPPWRRKWQPTLVFLPGKFQGQRSLAGYTVCEVTKLIANEHKHSKKGKHFGKNSVISWKCQIIQAVIRETIRNLLDLLLLYFFIFLYL